MARLESDREDLMQEATALVERAEFRIAGEPQTLIAGYRRDGSLSLYFGPDPCFHFDPELRLRRGYLDGQLYRTQGDTLARLTRVREDQQVNLQRHDLSAAELAELLQHIDERLRRFRADLAGGAICLAGVPDDQTVLKRLTESLEILIRQPLVLAPAIRGNR